MSDVIVDTTVWIAYFRGGKSDKGIADALDYLLSGDEAVLNEVLRSELLHLMRVCGEQDCAEAISAVRSPGLDIDWEGIRTLQETCLRNGINKVGIPDLIIAQQAIRLGIPIISLDAHFKLMAKCTPLKLWPQTE